VRNRLRPRAQGWDSAESALEDALKLVHLYAEKEQWEKFERAAMKFLWSTDELRGAGRSHPSRRKSVDNH
jgi:hypothetical protein